MKADKLHVIAVISNPKQYLSRYRLYRQFAKYMSNFDNVVLWTSELAIGNQEFVVTESDNPYHFQFRSKHALWHKENLINLTVERLPSGCKNIAAIDADVIFTDPNFAENTIEMLKEFPVGQMFTEVRDLMPNHITSEGRSLGFVYRYENGLYRSGKYMSGLGSPGFAWAFRRDVFEALGGLPDFPICGSADFFMATSFFGIVSDAIGKELGSLDVLPEYQQKLYDWQANAYDIVQGRVGYLPGALLHYWHGKRSERGYRTRNSYLIDAHYVPDRDLCYNAQGVLEFTNSNPDLIKSLDAYFGTRNEDGVEG